MPVRTDGAGVWLILLSLPPRSMHANRTRLHPALIYIRFIAALIDVAPSRSRVDIEEIIDRCQTNYCRPIPCVTSSSLSLPRGAERDFGDVPATRAPSFTLFRMKVAPSIVGPMEKPMGRKMLSNVRHLEGETPCATG